MKETATEIGRGDPVAARRYRQAVGGQERPSSVGGSPTDPVALTRAAAGFRSAAAAVGAAGRQVR